MSRIAKAPITVPAGVEVTLKGQEITVKGKNGELTRTINNAVEVQVNDNVITTLPRDGVANAWAQAGTARALINNMVMGVQTGFQKTLEMHGVGYRASVQGKLLDLLIGVSHPVKLPIPEGLVIKVDKNTVIEISGADKQLVGQFAANIRSKRPPEPYKGKGIRYRGEYIRRNAGKSAKK